ncbi:MAG: diaminopimelate epimerase [Cyclobacteriaceae bacterium]|nr:diaminopimelate epimerase [Cyclobacteriaceae bacterium]
MKIHFFKYQATGNDFVVINGDEQSFSPTPEILKQICDRRFGVGADGVIILKRHKDFDFEVLYYNPDGSESLCGNGTRAAIRFAQSLGLIKGESTHFLAFDGPHDAHILSDGDIRLQMNSVSEIKQFDEGVFMNTGSPHLVRFVPDLDATDVMGVGRQLRYETPVEGGTNVNFVEMKEPGKIRVRTYERGVENETLSCGTGVTACALATSLKNGMHNMEIITKGGKLRVDFINSPEKGFDQVHLTGPAERVFEGNYFLKG